MAATAERNTEEREGKNLSFPVAAGEKIFSGTIVAVDGDGNAQAAEDAADLVVQGRAEETKDNTDGEDGDLNINVKRGVFKFANSEQDPVTAAMRGQFCYVEDDQTVNATGGNNLVRAGIVVDIDDDGGVWVDTRIIMHPSTSVEDGAVTTAKLANTAVTAAKLASDAVTTAKILNANVTAAKLAADAVETAKIKDANVTLAKLAAGIAPSRIVIASGIHSWAGGAATTDSKAVAGILATDVVIATLAARNATETLVLAVANQGAARIDFTLSANGTDNTTKIQYAVLRAAA